MFLHILLSTLMSWHGPSSRRFPAISGDESRTLIAGYSQLIIGSLSLFLSDLVSQAYGLTPVEIELM
jgi:hypothetical protein